MPVAAAGALRAVEAGAVEAEGTGNRQRLRPVRLGAVGPGVWAVNRLRAARPFASCCWPANARFVRSL